MPGRTHQKSSGSTRRLPSTKNANSRPKFDGLNSGRPPTRIRYFDANDTTATTAKIHAPRRLHQSPCSVPGTRNTNATPFPVNSALAGHWMTRCRRNVIPSSKTAHVPTAIRICAIETSKCNSVWPSTWSDTTTSATCSRGSRTSGPTNGYIRATQPCSSGRPTSGSGSRVRIRTAASSRRGVAHPSASVPVGAWHRQSDRHARPDHGWPAPAPPRRSPCASRARSLMVGVYRANIATKYRVPGTR